MAAGDGAQVRDGHSMSNECRVRKDDHAVHAWLCRNGGESVSESFRRCDLDGNKRDTYPIRSCSCLGELEDSKRWILRIREDRRVGESWNRLLEKFESFSSRVDVIQRQTGDVGIWSVETVHDTNPEWIADCDHDDGYRAACRFGRETRRSRK